MSNAIKRKPIIAIAILLVAIPAYIAYSFATFDLLTGGESRYPGIGLGDYDSYGFFRINPETILASLKNGDKEVFLPEERDVEENVWGGPILYELPVPWRQSDYLMVANALNHFVWKDTLDNWGLFSMDFSTNCQDIPSGFREGGFEFFKTSFADFGRLRYTTRSLYMTPEYLSVVWGGDSNFPHPLLGWKGIDLSRVKISADDALKIADENGGREARLEVNDKCYASVHLRPEFWNGWSVSIGPFFKIYIDSYTGEIIE